MSPTIGRIVHYVLSEQDAEQINRRRTDGASIAERLRMRLAVLGESQSDQAEAPMYAWPAGAQAHIGNTAFAGQECPAMVVRDWEKENADAGRPTSQDPTHVPSINLQVFLDGTDVFWAQYVSEDASKVPSPGSWHWPARE